MDNLHPVKEVMKILGISRTNLYSIIKKGDIKPVKLGGRTMFPESEINRFLEALKNKDIE